MLWQGFCESSVKYGWAVDIGMEIYYNKGINCKAEFQSVYTIQTEVFHRKGQTS